MNKGTYENNKKIIRSCTVCDIILFPDDEAYNDEITGDILCGKHSIRNEVTENYVSSNAIFEVRDSEKQLFVGCYSEMLIAFYTLEAGFAEVFDVEHLADDTFENLKEKWVVPTIGEIKLMRVQ
jgi:hypothetical protein